MRVIPPITITEAMLTGSSVVETPPAFYAAGTTYGAGVTSCTGVVGGTLTVYKSLAASNIGNTPATSPTWWQNIGTTYSVYSAGVTYALGDTVIDPVNHLVYESQIAGNVGQPLATGTAWLKLRGMTNKWNAFDQLRNTQTVAPVDIVQTVSPGVRVNSIAVIGLDARSVTIEVRVAGALKYKVTVNLSKRKSRTLTQYFFGGFPMRTSVQFFNLPPYRNADITVTVSKPTGQRGVGGILVGNAIYIGDTQYNPESNHLNFSGVERDKFGNIDLNPRRSVPTVSEQIWFDKKLTSTILELREALNGRPAIYSGLDDFTHDYFDPLFLFGIHKEFSVNLAQHDYGIISLQVEEL
ncbi:hypothetical protein [Rugamonas rubra]|uniref:Carbohydrate binding domain-containing protein n=1 Tax=Rugamonas rubra TaxID=758825 RepID=A0A1I4SG89_9BURK|nr:hypothetical protein [Rugamonas rubra]SFM63496.1 hypothetical protein SAMN02982985_04760 [Rugamonas rubra]